MTARALGRASLSLSVAAILGALSLGELRAQSGGASQLLASARQIAGDVSLLRGLAFRRNPALRVVTRQQMVRALRARVQSLYSTEALLDEGSLLESLGLIDDSGTYEAQTYERLGERLAGFYDPGSETLYLAGWLELDEQLETMIHETAHALQDQHFDLDRLLSPRPGRADELLAASAVVEGDATAVTLALTSGQGRAVLESRRAVRELRRALGAGGGRRRDPVGEHLQRTAAFTYGEGLALVQRRYQERGWAAVDELLRRPPMVSAAVLRPDQVDLAARALEPRPSIPATLSGAYEVSLREQVGELQLREVLQRWGPSSDPEVSTRGWRGDQALLMTPTSGSAPRAMIFTSRWASEADASRFEGALGDALSRRHGRPSPGDLTTRWSLGAGRCALLSRRGVAVSWSEQLPCDSGIAAE